MASCAAGWRAALRAVRVSGDPKRKSCGEMSDLRLGSPLTLYAGRQAGARQPVEPEPPQSSPALRALCVTAFRKRASFGNALMFSASPCLHVESLSRGAPIDSPQHESHAIGDLLHPAGDARGH